MKFRNISELEGLMSEEAKEKAKADFHKFFTVPFGDSPVILCGPEARAAAAGKLDEYYAEGEEYLKKVDLENWDEEGKE